MALIFDKETNIKNLQTYIPSTLMSYIQKHLNDEVVHIYYGNNLYKQNRIWPIVPYTIKPYQKHNNYLIVDHLKDLALFSFLKDIKFIIYNDTYKPLNIDLKNFIILGPSNFSETKP
ncbi:hypothetical protein MrNuV_ORF102 [Macrobrachium rosenbergii nudivirus]|nr:hypothetical protein MrNuV_ORF102 [Macrobrachium rosenbergii nudivirus]